MGRIATDAQLKDGRVRKARAQAAAQGITPVPVTHSITSPPVHEYLQFCHPDL